MLKVGSKRRRTAAQLSDLKEEELRKEEGQGELERKNKELQDKLDIQEAQSKQAFEAKDLLAKLYEQGQLKKNERGEWEVQSDANRANFKPANVKKPKQQQQQQQQQQE